MDDQFNGRTDDDLFADDFEPAPESAVEVVDDVQPSAKAQSDPTGAAAPYPKPVGQQAAPASPAHTAAAAAPPPNAPSGPKGLAHSRHNKPAAGAPRPPRQHVLQGGGGGGGGPKPKNASSSPAATTSSTDAAVADKAAAPSSTAATHGKGKAKADAAGTQPETSPSRPNGLAAAPSTTMTTHTPATPAAGGSARLGSGANPRTKPTDEELAAKMARMRVLAAEQTRRFEQAQRDETAHAAAYARGMEEAQRRRRAADEERRRREAHEQESQARIDSEREKNRERKLRAFAARQAGTWDDGKEERMRAEEERGFRGANGGVRGVKGEGLAGSRFARDGPKEGEARGHHAGGSDGDGRGRGRARGGRGRGSRGGRYDDGYAEGSGHGRHQNGDGRPAPHQAGQTVPARDDFPALPQAHAKNVDTPPPPATLPEIPLSPPVGKWDEEVAASDALARS